jgi:TPR repeat protein
MHVYLHNPRAARRGLFLVPRMPVGEQVCVLATYAAVSAAAVVVWKCGRKWKCWQLTVSSCLLVLVLALLFLGRITRPPSSEAPPPPPAKMSDEAMAQQEYMRWEARDETVESNLTESFKHLLNAANMGHPKAQYEVGFMYSSGRGVEQDYEQAREWYAKAAEKGHHPAQDNLGLLYEHGYGGAVDKQMAKRYYEQAAANNSVMGHYHLAMWYVDEGEHAKAIEHLKVAAKADIAEAQSQLALCYYGGQGVKRNYNEAFEWFQKAADQGDGQAQFDLARMYRDAQGTAQDLGKAANWFAKAARNGVWLAYYELGMTYFQAGELEKAYKSLNDALEKEKALPNIFEEGAEETMREILKTRPDLATHIDDVLGPK